MPGGMFIGTCSGPQPVPGIAIPMNMDVSKADSSPPHLDYMADDPYVRSTFSNVPDGENAWWWASCSATTKYLIGSDVNDTTYGGDPNDPYVLFEISSEPHTSLFNPWIFLDDVSIVIY